MSKDVLQRRLPVSKQLCTKTSILQSTAGAEYTLDRPCTSTVVKLLFPQSEEGWACCTPNVVQTLVFYCRLPGLNRHWIDLVHPLSENYIFYSRNKFGQLFPNILSTLVINSRYTTLDHHFTDRHRWQSVMFSAWVV